MLSGGRIVAGGSVDDDDAALGGRRNVDIVDSDAGASDHFHLGGGSQDPGGEFGLAADSCRIVVANHGLELFRLHVQLDIDIESRTEQINALRRYRITNQ